MRRVVYPGSFDPITFGHLDVIGRAAPLFDELIVGVGANPSKTRLFEASERLHLAQEALVGKANVRVLSFSGLLTEFCREQNVSAIIKGLRTSSDFDYEISQSQMNTHLSGIPTVYLPTSPDRSFLSSSLVKEVAHLGGDVSDLVPPFVAAALSAKLASTKN
jgi:pantetheine-phosphate adenylyltransferase